MAHHDIMWQGRMGETSQANPLMSVIIELSLPRQAFALGRILPRVDEVEYSLETIVPLGEAPTPFIRVHDVNSTQLVDEVIEHPSVNSMELQTTADDEEIYRLEWEYEIDEFLTAVHDYGGHVLSGDSFRGAWQFTLQFPDHASVSAFEETLQEVDIENQVLSVENQWVAGTEMDGSMTDAQREALELAYRTGYYHVPRRTSTSALARELDISDQAVTERLRRGVDSLIAAVLPGLDRE